MSQNVNFFSREIILCEKYSLPDWWSYTGWGQQNFQLPRLPKANMEITKFPDSCDDFYSNM